MFDEVEFVIPAMKVAVKTKVGKRKVMKRNPDGTPIYDYRIFAKERPRFARRGGKAFVYNNPNTENFEKHIRLHYPTDKHHYLGCRVYNEKECCKNFSVSNCKGCKSRRKNLGIDIKVYLRDERHIDLDNILKIVLDALDKVCFFDDTQFAIKRIELIPNTEIEHLSVRLYAFNPYFVDGIPVGLYTLKNLPVEFAMAHIKDLFGRTGNEEAFIAWVKRVEDRKQVLGFLKELGEKHEKATAAS
jgi:Holliday junction resolvase RusA-like endonuclease